MPNHAACDIEPILDEAAIEVARRRIDELLGDGPRIRPSFLRDRIWNIAAIAGQPEIEDCERICVAAKCQSVDHFVVASIEDSEISNFMHVPVRGQALAYALGWGHRSLTNLVSISSPFEILVLKDATDYYVVCGSSACVEMAIGQSIDDARELFEREARARIGNPRYVDLMPIVDLYRSI